MNINQFRNVTAYQVTLKKPPPTHATGGCLVPEFLFSAIPVLPVDVFLPVVRRRRGVSIRASEHHVALALVHHAARLLVVIERHGRGRHRLDVDGDICFTVRNNYALEKGIAHLGVCRAL